MNMPSLKGYIKKTYRKLGEINYSNYWNLGYINALKDKKLITDKEVDILNDYNCKIYDSKEGKK